MSDNIIKENTHKGELNMKNTFRYICDDCGCLFDEPETIFVDDTCGDDEQVCPECGSSYYQLFDE